MADRRSVAQGLWHSPGGRPFFFAPRPFSRVTHGKASSVAPQNQFYARQGAATWGFPAVPSLTRYSIRSQHLAPHCNAGASSGRYSTLTPRTRLFMVCGQGGASRKGAMQVILLIGVPRRSGMWLLAKSLAVFCSPLPFGWTVAVTACTPFFRIWPALRHVPWPILGPYHRNSGVSQISEAPRFLFGIAAVKPSYLLAVVGLASGHEQHNSPSVLFQLPP